MNTITYVQKSINIYALKETINITNGTVLATTVFISLIFFLQMFYTFIAIFIKNKKFKKSNKKNNHLIIIPAHNEAHIVPDLVKSLKSMKYPTDKFKVVVVADNCTDDTAKVCLEAGADKVYERFNKELIGPNFAVHETLLKIKEELGEFDSFSGFDADNLVDENGLSVMNDAFNDPKNYDYFTSFRDTQNFSDNGISSSYSIEFYRLVSQVATSRSFFGNPHMVGGTGFMVRGTLLEKNDYGGKYKSMVHDTEFSFDALANGYNGVYVDQAHFYDLQPTKFDISGKQRTRGTVGNFKLFPVIWKTLFKNLFFKVEIPQKKLNYLDYIAMLSPAGIGFVLLFLGNFLISLENIVYISYTNDFSFLPVGGALALPMIFVFYYLTSGVMGLSVLIRQSSKMKHIRFKNKIKALFSYPLFLFLNIPLSISAQKNINMKFLNTKKERR